jgi:hypothetical protein
MAGAMPCFKVHVAVKLQDIWAIIDPLSENGDESADLLRQVSRQPCPISASSRSLVKRADE